MMFVGAIPRESVVQAFRIMPMDQIKEVYVCCSGSFRFEQSFNKAYPDTQIFSNDVSLLTTTLGRAAMGRYVDFAFVRDLEYLEEAIKGSTDPLDRVAAMAVALRTCHFRGNNPHTNAHRDHYKTNVAMYIERAKGKITPYLQALKIQGFYQGDFRDHAEEAIKKGAAIFSWPPLLHGDYERFYRPIDKNTEWREEVPRFRDWKPKTELPQWLRHLNASDATYCVCTDRDLAQEGFEDLKPVALYAQGRVKRIYIYARHNARKGGLIMRQSVGLPFRYDPIHTDRLTQKTKVTVVPVESKHMNFVKDKYQLAGLIHSDGFMRFLVFLDGMLAGGFIFVPNDKMGQSTAARLSQLYLLSDFSTSRERKLSKLIAMLGTGIESTTQCDRRLLQRTSLISTTAFSNAPVSMKYRGIFELYSRKEIETHKSAVAGGGKFMLNYQSKVRRQTNAEIYAEWWRKYGKDAK